MVDRVLFIPALPNAPKRSNLNFRGARKFIGTPSKSVYGDRWVRKGPKFSQSVNINPDGSMDIRKIPDYLNTAKDIYNTAQEVKSTVTQVVNEIKGTGDSSNPNNSSHSYGKDVPPSIETRLNTNVPVVGYVSVNHEPVENLCSPLHLTAGKFFIQATGTAGGIREYFDSNVVPKIQQRFNKAVNFQTPLTVLSSGNLATAFIAILDGLQLYYYINSILAFGELPNNTNGGMSALKAGITPDLYNSYNLLYERLLDAPIPPKMLDLVRYFYGNYTSGVAESSPIVKFVPNFMNTSSVLPSTTDFANAMTNLNATTTVDVCSQLTRALPEWTNHGLPSVPVMPIYDKVFLTTWINAPYITTNNAKFPISSTTDSELSYSSLSNELDGFVFAMCDNYVGGTLWPSLWGPIGGAGKPSRMSYYEVSGTKGFYDANAYPFLQALRNEVHRVDSTTQTVETHYHIFGTEKVRGVTSKTMLEAAKTGIQYMISVDDIPILESKSRRSGYSRSSAKTGDKDVKRKGKR